MIFDGNQESTQVASVLMIGQSNMAGRGNMEDVAPIRDKRCFVLRNARWQPMREPVNPDRAIFEGMYRSGVSLASSFARDYAQHFDAPVGLIPCADGGTALNQWMPGEILYDHAVCITKLAQRSSKLTAIIWHQGENDCSNDELVESYQGRFTEMITQLRKDLGAEDVPVILGEIHPDIKEMYTGGRQIRLNQVFAQIASSLPLCAVASAQGLQLKPDGLHFDAQSCREFGSRYFQKYLELL